MPRATKLACPSCRRWYTVAELFDNCTGLWRERRWLTFKCKRCKVHSSLVLGPRTLTIGSLDGGPGPCFIPGGRISVSYGRSFSKTEATVTYAGSEWTFKAHASDAD